MTHREEDLDRILDEALEALRRERPDATFVAEASERVWGRLDAGARAAAAAAVRIEGCAGFREMIAAHLRGELAPARRLLFEDHLGECVSCRRELKQQRAGVVPLRPGVSRPAAGSGRLATWGLRLAAAAVFLLAVVGVSFKTDALSFESGGVIRIEAVSGELIHLTAAGGAPVAPGAVLELGRGEVVRTAKGSSAVLRLADDSQVEMRERSELAVRQRRHVLPGRAADDVIGLARGSIIIEASDQGSGHLFVDTDDCRVAVTGTVFSVNAGMKGSRVSVLEGEVHVEQSGRTDVLQPGEQATTSAALDKVPLEQEIAWSRESERYVALLRELRAVGREMDEVLHPELRTTTELLDLVPADSVVYVAMPNVSDGLAEAYDILRERAEASPVLREWWESALAGDTDEELRRMFDKIRTYGDQLGPEIVLAVSMKDGEMDESPLFLSRVTDPGRFVGLIEAERDALGETDRERLHLIEGPLTHAVPGVEFYLWVTGDWLAASPSFPRLAAVNAVLGRASASLSGPFRDRLAERYDEGVEWLVGVDLRSILGQAADPDSALGDLGLLDVQHVIAERRQHEGRAENRAVLTFDQPRRRLAAWLAEPAPIGSLDYVGPDASLAVAFAMKDLGTLVDELFEIVGARDPQFEEHLAEFEREAGLSVRRDAAAPLGGEFALALDGPVLPVPSWKLVVEVYDPAHLQQTIEWLVGRIDELARRDGGRGLAIRHEEAGEAEYWTIESLDTGLAATYRFHDGYLVAAPSRTLVERALEAKTTGVTLADSPGFASLLPVDGRVNLSGVVYHHLSPVLGPLSGTIASALPEEQRAMIEAVGSEGPPGLVLFYGETDRISVIGTSEGGLFSSGLGALSGFTGLLGMQESLFEALSARAGAAGGDPGSERQPVDSR
jgi:hypothetical protein